MKSFIIVVALIVCFFTSKAQNLIDNWSFEDTVSCPIWAGQINQSTGWMSFRNSPDYFHVCHTNPLQFGVPNNSFDYQYPRTGNAYAGFIAFLLSGFNTREALGTQLNSTLQIGQKYFATFYVSRVAKNLSSINVAIDKIGLKFSTVAYSHPNFPPSQ